jgi:hypothetical protein
MDMSVFEMESPSSSSASWREEEYGEALPAQSPYSEALPAEAPYAEGPYAEAPFAAGSPGEWSHSESPYSESPYSESPYAESPYSESPYSESPYSESAYSESRNGESPYGESSYGAGEALFTSPPSEEAFASEFPATESAAAGPYELESPFLSGASFAATLPAEQWTGAEGGSELESPFLTAATAETTEASERSAFADLLGELEDEQFDAAVARLVDEAAAMQLSSESSWSSAEAGSAMSLSELEAWIEPLANESDRLLGEMGNRLAAEELEVLRDSELESLLESMRPQTGYLPAEFEDFLGGLFDKAKSLVKGAVNLAKKGIQAVGRVLPVGWLLEKLRGLVKPLLRKVLNQAMGRLPVSLQPLARRLADKFLGEAGEAGEALESELEDGGLAREFDIQVARLVQAADEHEAESLVAEVETESQATSNAIGDLDSARARFAEQVTELPAGTAPVAELEQFIPAIMAVLPAVRLGINIVGRDKIVRFLADRVAGLISGVVGAEAAKALAGPIVDVGLRMLTLEAPAAGEAALGGEALASTVEETVRQVLELPAEAFEDTLRLEAEIQQAFAEAAARHIPSERLRPDLPELESLAGGTWVLMPRVARPSYRYKKFSRVFVVPITRQMARVLPTADGGTVETMLLDRGVTSWPAEAEVHLYETLPGTQLGHIAQFEGEGETPAGEVVGELQVLTPEAASLLLREPDLGRPYGRGQHHHHHRGTEPLPLSAAGTGAPVSGIPAGSTAPAVVPATVAAPPLARPVPPGVRLYRLNVPGLRAAAGRPRHRIRVHLDAAARPPTIRVRVHLSEREGQDLAAKLQRRDSPGAFLLLRRSFHHVAPAVLTARLLRHGSRLIGSPVRTQRAVHLSLVMTEAMTQALSALVASGQGDMARAVQNVKQGITITFLFRAERAAWVAGRVNRPSVTVQAGWHG